jgi:hypothetical protein
MDPDLHNLNPVDPPDIRYETTDLGVRHWTSPGLPPRTPRYGLPPLFFHHPLCGHGRIFPAPSRPAGPPVPGPQLTATVTATAATTGHLQRPATAHNSNALHANSGYVRPEKQKVGTASLLPLTGPQAQGWTGSARAATVSVG